jgi:hypothetical protein
MSGASYNVVGGRILDLVFPGMIDTWQMNLDLARAEKLAAKQPGDFSFDYEFKVSCTLQRTHGIYGTITTLVLSEGELEVIRLTIQDRIKLKGVRVDHVEIANDRRLIPTTGDGRQIWTFVATMVHS